MRVKVSAKLLSKRLNYETKNVFQITKVYIRIFIN